jgi:hypothetical protein
LEAGFYLAIFQKWELVIHGETLPDNQGEEKAKRQGLTRWTPQKVAWLTDNC